MKRNPLSGVRKVYAFTLKQVCTAKGWLISTFLIAVLLLCGIPALVLLVTSKSEDKTPDDDEATIRHIIVCDETEGTVDYSYLTEFGYSDVTYEAAADMEAAKTLLTDADSMAILQITKTENCYALTIYLDDESEISRSAGHSFASFAESNFTYAKIMKSQIDPQALTLLMMPVSVSSVELKTDVDTQHEKSSLEEGLAILLPFIVLTLVYMMVALYGVMMGQNILLEKTSYLMDTMLTSIDPLALIFGKLFAVVSGAVVQMLIWLVSAVGGCVISVFAAYKSFPETSNEIVVGMDQVLHHSELFSVSGLVFAILIFALGILMYLSLATISGSMASKAEELGKTNIVFVFTLLGSFLLVVSSQSGGEIGVQGAQWQLYFPFTALLVAPGKLLLGEISAARGVLIACIIFATTCLLVFIASRIYRMLALYRGNPPTPKALLAMFKDNKKHNKGESSDV